MGHTATVAIHGPADRDRARCRLRGRRGSAAHRLGRGRSAADLPLEERLRTPGHGRAADHVHRLVVHDGVRSEGHLDTQGDRPHGRSLPGGQRASALWSHMGWRSGALRSRPSRPARTPTSVRSRLSTESWPRGLRLERDRYPSRDWLGIERLANARLKGLPLGRNVWMGLRNDRRGRRRCDHRWNTHPPHVVDRLPVGRGGQRLPGTRPRWRAAGIVIATTPTQTLYSTIDWIATELPARPCITPSCD